ncbi:GGDEF domain-containing protein [Octadecabacter sp. R77987]|uniref:GGDEF domain-containing protein n=1 Tax=Octadecabacter sp. R77987 TaxID=3093874 RepID=UPI00366A5C83
MTSLSASYSIADAARFRLIRQGLRLRRPLAACSLILAFLALIETFAGVDALLRPIADGPATHPLTALMLLSLSVGVLSFRHHQPTPVWRYVLSGICLLIAGERTLEGFFPAWQSLLSGGLETWVFQPLAANLHGELGSDTAFVLTMLFASVIVRRHFGRIGLTFNLVAIAAILNAFVGMSYGLELFDGHMSMATLLSLIPLSLAVLTLYLHRPFVRVALLLGDVGKRTRIMMMVGFLVPWACGFVLHRMFHVTERMVPVETMIISLIIWCMVGTAVHSGVIQERVDRARRMTERKLARMATHDPLTGILNRRGLHDTLAQRWDIFTRSGVGTGIVLIDLDHFKKINDQLGHDEGDRILAKVGEVLRPQFRHGDVLGRWGGEEFMLILDTDDPERLAAICERVRLAISRIPLKSGGAADVHTTVSASLGLSQFLPGDIANGAAIRRADEALYAAKGRGRNCVVAYGGPDARCA